MFCMSVYILKQIKTETTENSHQTLDAILHTVQASHRVLINQRKLHASTLADFQIIESMTSSLLERSLKNQTIIDSKALTSLRHIFTRELAKNNDRGFFIISPDRINIASMRDSNIGVINLIHKTKPELLDKAFKGEATLIPTIYSDVPLLNENKQLIEKAPTMFVLAPIHSSIYENEVIAVLALRIDTTTHFSNVTKLGRFGDTIETYAIDKSGKLLTESRFISDLIETGLINEGEKGTLNIRVTDPGGNLLKGFHSPGNKEELPLTFMARSVIENGDGFNIDGYRDYRGVDVIGTWVWDRQSDFGLTTEIDVEEALLPYYRTRIIFIAGNIITLLIVILFIWIQFLSNRKLLRTHSELESRVEKRTVDLSTARNELVKINNELAQAQTRAKMGSWKRDLKTKKGQWSDEMFKLFGLQSQLNPPLFSETIKLIHPDDQIEFQNLYNTAISNGRDYSVDVRLPQPDGTNIWIEARSETVYDESGNLVLLRGTAQDITVRKQAERKLLTSNHLLDESQKLAKVGGWELNLATGKLFWTAETYNIHDTSPQEFNPTVDAGVEYFLPESRETITQAIDAAINECKDYDLELETYTTKGRKIDVHTTCSVIKEHGKAVKLRGIFQDITQQKKDEKALRHSSKMDAVGQMAGGIAHDFNNLLSIIMGNLNFLERDTKGNEKATRRIEQIDKATHRAATLTKQLLRFSHKLPFKSVIAEVNEILVSMDSLICRSITPEVMVNLQLSEFELFTKVDIGDLEGAILNLIINARDAMPGGGELYIKTDKCTLSPAYCEKHSDIVPGEYILIEVQDNGKGMTSSEQELIFEPFYTTKLLGKGTGLGLSMVYSFVNRSKGHITVSSTVDVGTSFKVFLPQSEKNVSDVVEVTKIDLQIEGKGTILVVEDEDGLLELAEEFLKYLGYKVITANNGNDALMVLKQNSNIDILFSDILMPGGINGYELAKYATEMLPNLKVILTSGYNDENSVLEGMDFSGKVLKKPYTQSDLSQHIHKHLVN